MDPIGSGKNTPTNSMTTRRRVHKWKKLASVRGSRPSGGDIRSSIGEKRPKGGDLYDEDMEDIDERGNFKKRVVLMEVDTQRSHEVESVASPTTWALGSQ